MSAPSASHTEPVTARQAAEWEPVQTVLLCEPGIETLFAVIETEAANFLRPFDLLRARAEHRRFRSLIEAHGARTIDLRDALRHGAPEDEHALANLRRWASEALEYALPAESTIGEQRHAERHRRETIEALDAGSLADLMLLRPFVRMWRNPRRLDPTSAYQAWYGVRPASNAYFMRDPMITTARGAVIGRLRLDVRRIENDIVEQALHQLGVDPVCRVEAPGFLEGGDFLPCGSFALQGRGLLTTQEGIDQLLEARAYGDVEVAVVCDPRAEMDEMHLDSYFAILDCDLCAICDDRLGVQEPTVEVWEPDGGRYRHVGSRPFLEYLRSKGMTVLTFTKAQQGRFAANGLLVAPRWLIGDAEAGPEFADLLADAGVNAAWIRRPALLEPGHRARAVRPTGDARAGLSRTPVDRRSRRASRQRADRGAATAVPAASGPARAEHQRHPVRRRGGRDAALRGRPPA
jgi:arginine deiminase